MIRNSPFGVSPTVTVSIDEVPVNYVSLMSVSLDLEENKHDLCKITMAGVPSRSITDFIGQNAYVRVSTGTTMYNDFYGTIFKSVPTATTAAGLTNDSLFQEVVFTCLGCSYAMRGATSKVWNNSTLVDVATSLADKYGFSVDVPADDLVFNRLVQAESDWQFLLRYANNMGYSVTVHGTHIHIFDPHDAKGRLISLNRLTSPAKSSAQPHPGQITRFEGDFAQRAADGVTFDNIVTVISDSGGTFDVRTSEVNGLSEPAAFDTRLNLTTDTYAQAQRLIQSLHRREYDYRASCDTIGTAGMYPGGVANVDGYSDAFDGLWYVHAVTHDVRSGSFTTKSDLRRNSVETLVSTSVEQFRQPPQPTAVTGVWTSTQKTAHVY